jgi:hypothetical protein
MCTETRDADLVRVFGERVRPCLGNFRNASKTEWSHDRYGDERLRLIREKDGWLVRHYPQLQSHGELVR